MGLSIRLFWSLGRPMGIMDLLIGSGVPNMSRVKFLSVTILTVAGLLSASPDAHAQWAAAVWSPQTNRYGAANNLNSEFDALVSARLRASTPAGGIVVTACNGVCVIVMDTRGRVGTGVGWTLDHAIRNAHRYCPLGEVKVWASSRELRIDRRVDLTKETERDAAHLAPFVA